MSRATCGPGVPSRHPEDALSEFLRQTATARHLVWQARVALQAVEDAGPCSWEEWRERFDQAFLRGEESVEMPTELLVLACEQLEYWADLQLRGTVVFWEKQRAKGGDNA